MTYAVITNFFAKENTFDDVNILCIGDVILDSFFECKTDRISSESPTPVMVVKNKIDFLGGSGNVANNIVSFGAKSTCVGAIKHDVAGGDIVNLFNKNNINFAKFDQDGTIVKQRYFCGKHSIFRSDYEFFCQKHQKIVEYVEENIKNFDAVIISNYNYDLINKNVAQAVIKQAKKHGVLVFVDPNKGKNLDWYSGAFLLKPNLSEFEQIVGKKFDLNIDQIVKEARDLLQQYDIENILITMSEHGQLFVNKNEYRHFENILQSGVIDVSGAGDTVIAASATFFCKTKDLILSVQLANLAANLVVRQFGTSQTNLSEMKHYFYKEKAELIHYNKTDLKNTVDYLRSNGKVVGLANGCFDILHEGHIKLLNNAKKHCDFLIVAINSDSSVKKLKGESRPFNNEFSRTLVISNVAAVDGVIIFDELSPVDLILHLKPDVVFKGKDYNEKTLPEYDPIVSYGGKVEFLDLMEGFSTTNVINKMKNG